MSGSKIVVVIGGNAHHGKDTLADMLAERLPRARRDSYAAPLKACVYLKTGIPMEILNGPASVKEDTRFGRYGKSPRQLMQEEGEEARQRISTTVWMDRLLDRVSCEPERVTVVSDGRHPQEEFTQLREKLPKGSHFFGVRIVRPSEPVHRGHPSEDRIADAPDSLFDFVVLNDSDLSVLALKAEQLADAIVLTAKHGKLNGWVVRCPNGMRMREPFVEEEEAKVFTRDRIELCVTCGSPRGHFLEPAVFGLITS